jgi:hypothetical protein
VYRVSASHYRKRTITCVHMYKVSNIFLESLVRPKFTGTATYFLLLEDFHTLCKSHAHCLIIHKPTSSDTDISFSSQVISSLKPTESFNHLATLKWFRMELRIC